jgi:ribosomal protein S27AE
VARNAAQAKREGREVVSQSVVIKRTICPECGRSVIAGGETRTVTKKADDGGKQPEFNVKPTGEKPLEKQEPSAAGREANMAGKGSVNGGKREYGGQIPVSVGRQSPYGVGAFGDSKGTLFDRAA